MTMTEMKMKVLMKSIDGNRQHCRLSICFHFYWAWQTLNQNQTNQNQNQIQITIRWWDERACLDGNGKEDDAIWGDSGGSQLDWWHLCCSEVHTETASVILFFQPQSVTLCNTLVTLCHTVTLHNTVSKWVLQYDTQGTMNIARGASKFHIAHKSVFFR